MPLDYLNVNRYSLFLKLYLQKSFLHIILDIFLKESYPDLNLITLVTVLRMKVWTNKTENRTWSELGSMSCPPVLFHFTCPLKSKYFKEKEIIFAYLSNCWFFQEAIHRFFCPKMQAEHFPFFFFENIDNIDNRNKIVSIYERYKSNNYYVKKWGISYKNGYDDTRI